MIFIDAILVKVRDGKVANRPVYIAVGVTVDGEARHPRAVGRRRRRGRQVLASGADRDQEPRRRRLHRRLRRPQGPARGDRRDVWPLAIVQTCVLHLIRNTFRYASKGLGRAGPRPAARLHRRHRAGAGARLDEFAAKWGERYPAIMRLWENAWAEFVPFLDYSPEIRKVIYSHERDREPQRPLPPRASGPAATSPTSRPRSSASTSPCAASTPPAAAEPLDEPMEARPQRLRRHLRRPNQPQRQLT